MTKSTPVNQLLTSDENQNENDNEETDIQNELQSINAETYVMAPPTQPRDTAIPTYTPLTDMYGVAASPPNSLSPILAVLNSVELKLAAICAAVFITVYQIPLEKIIYSYISLDKLPFSEVIIKAIIAGLLFFVLARVVLIA